MASSSSSLALELLHALRGEFSTGGGSGGSTCLFYPLGGTITEPHRRPSGLQMTARRRSIQSALPTAGADALALRSKMARLPVKRWESILQPRSLPVISTEMGERMRRTREPISAEMLDKWTRDSVGEIVRNTRGGSPFFVHIFSDSKGESRRLRLEMEAALPDSWPRVKKRWEREENCRLDAVILVEELGVSNGDQQDYCCCCSESKLSPADEEEKAAVGAAAKQLPTSRAISKTWGLLVQGRGTNCAACYILNTNRVRSSVGSCTHFCLTRGRLGEPLDVQLKRSWLHQS